MVNNETDRKEQKRLTAKTAEQKEQMTVEIVNDRSKTSSAEQLRGKWKQFVNDRYNGKFAKGKLKVTITQR